MALTALDDPSVRQDAREAGCDLIESNRCKTKDLRKGIQELLENTYGPVLN
jgi:hypothetical protein